MTGYYTDAFDTSSGRSPAGWSMALSFDQDLGERLGALFRYAYASEDFRDFKQRAALGLQIKHPFRYRHDRIGLGAWWGDPTDSALHDEMGLEMFWKLQIAPYLEVSPDLQIILNPQDAADQGAVLVAGLRLRLLL